MPSDDEVVTQINKIINMLSEVLKKYPNANCCREWGCFKNQLHPMTDPWDKGLDIKDGLYTIIARVNYCPFCGTQK